MRLRRPRPDARLLAALASGERLLATARDDARGVTLLAGTHALHEVTDDEADGSSSPWHLIESGSWDDDADTLRISWVDRRPPSAYVLAGADGLVTVFRERVDSSVVHAESVDLGDGRAARVVLRRDFAAGTLLTQAVLDRGVARSDPGVAEALEAGIASVLEQAGLD